MFNLEPKNQLGRDLIARMFKYTHYDFLNGMLDVCNNILKKII